MALSNKILNKFSAAWATGLIHSEGNHSRTMRNNLKRFFLLLIPLNDNINNNIFSPFQQQTIDSAEYEEYVFI